MSIISEDTYKLLGFWSSESSASSEIKMPEYVVCGAMHCCVVGVSEQDRSGSGVAEPEFL